MTRRFKAHAARREAGRLVRAQPYKVVDCPEAFELLAEEHMSLSTKEGTDLKWLHYWAAITPVQAVELFQKEYGNSAMLLQYAMGALEHHPVELTFFYIPQIVQALRDDEYGYVEQFIFETSKISQLFCHQIIWNMKANSYKDDDAEVPDPMKPTLDRMVDLIVAALSGEAQDFYDREFGFFNEVTSISGKLKPYIKKSKAEKKAKIDEEMAKIKVDPGVYLPSNPDGVVVDLARKSGRPLQSHAKAPFMATFKVHRDVKSDEDGDAEEPADGKVDSKGIDVWQAAIFKVGDDCRQDVLALQAVAMLKNIWQSVGLDLYLNPYRVTATGPGCGVIDVVPNATSRDEMGRAQINDLNSFFLTKYGNADSIAYQQARLHFVRRQARVPKLARVVVGNGHGHVAGQERQDRVDRGVGRVAENLVGDGAGLDADLARLDHVDEEWVLDQAVPVSDSLGPEQDGIVELRGQDKERVNREKGVRGLDPAYIVIDGVAVGQCLAGVKHKGKINGQLPAASLHPEQLGEVGVQRHAHIFPPNEVEADNRVGKLLLECERVVNMPSKLLVGHEADGAVDDFGVQNSSPGSDLTSARAS
ncbi:hypothetical protein L7F22_007295 [Adiantum nelumboides]|nr:hypothetical protein [Adiantum nelumboides]